MACLYLQSAQEDRELLHMKQEELEQQITSTNEAEERYHHDSQPIRDRSGFFSYFLQLYC